MRRFRPSFHRVSIAGCAALMYAVLAVTSAGCALAHADRAQDHHHHSEGNSSAQNAFCVWACQVTSDIVMAAESPKAAARLAVAPNVVAAVPLLVSSGSTVLQPRAPPSAEFLRHG
ncbi:MAG: hypothetical protein KF693_10735 [Nitrospira sp.]|nr:hypothetical protein [Nitrospira sp.]